MITQELRQEIYKDRKCFIHSAADLCREPIRSRMFFTDEADLDFELIDYFYHGVLSKIIDDMQIVSAYGKFSRGYEHGKIILSHYVGWYAKVLKEKQPALCSSKAYEVVMKELEAACWKGHDEGSRSRNARYKRLEHAKEKKESNIA